MNAKTHPFFCYKKNCQKSAWKTPEYLTSEDWELAERVIAVLERNPESLKLFTVLYEDFSLGQAFFNRVIGWPEGFNYCRSLEYLGKTAIPSLTKHTLPKLKAAVNLHLQKV
jgi:hypothetical protein